jgi:hypothetical protein
MSITRRKVLFRAKWLALVLFAAVVLTLTLSAPASAGAPPKPRSTVQGGDLYGVTAVSSSNVWAVGALYQGGIVTGLVEHWDGSTWSIVPNPANMPQAQLFGVAALSANDIWLVGGTWVTDVPIILHWDGAALSIVDSPIPGDYSQLSGVAALSSTNVYAVGDYTPQNGYQSQTLIEHWNGTSWQVVGSPNVGNTANVLNGITAISTNDIWAVGYTYYGVLAEHWDGFGWTIVQSDPNNLVYYGVAATASNDVWAVGGAESAISHWNGSTWQQVPSPGPAISYDNGLFAVAALTPSDAWAVGNAFGAGSTQTLTLHWNGSSWQLVPSPGRSTNIFDNTLYSVAAIASNDVWAVGGHNGPYAIHWNGSTWTAGKLPASR